MEIKFKKEYPDETCWSEVVQDFLTKLSKQYGYNIDQYDLLAMPEMTIKDRLAKLSNSNHESVTYLTAFMGACRQVSIKQEYCNTARQRARDVANAHKPPEDE